MGAHCVPDAGLRRIGGWLCIVKGDPRGGMQKKVESTALFFSGKEVSLKTVFCRQLQRYVHNKPSVNGERRAVWQRLLLIIEVSVGLGMRYLREYHT